jgi:hypothetical protein
VTGLKPLLIVGKTVIFISAFNLLTLKQTRTSRWRFVAIWCQNGGALSLNRDIEMTLFNGLLAKKQLNQTGAYSLNDRCLEGIEII